jgi:hypothetical protein
MEEVEEKTQLKEKGYPCKQLGEHPHRHRP